MYELFLERCVSLKSNEVLNKEKTFRVMSLSEVLRFPVRYIRKSSYTGFHPKSPTLL